MNILDIARVAIRGETLRLLWGYFQFGIVPFGFMLTVICLQYYCRLMRYVKGEAMLLAQQQAIMLDEFRTKMVIEYKRSCKLLLCLVAWFIVWMVGLISMSVHEIDARYLESTAFWSIYLAGNILHGIGFCCYLWIRDDPVRQDDYMKKSMDAAGGDYNMMMSNHNGVEVRM